MALCAGLGVAAGPFHSTTFWVHEGSVVACCRIGCQASASVSALSCTDLTGAPCIGSNLWRTLSPNLFEIRSKRAFVVLPALYVASRNNRLLPADALALLHSAMARRN
ncbi:hypothetical protein PR003_g15046 [Phytophthora rubi]|uniref:Uncharacterized protein n=1 Tax=Phytophthora rubi TaxID=129364 RepID=A0A6A4FAA2_9STRA|nr:hypothetical protein PR001_g14838 [Phytophthora rubi]KAE9331354.1 hypothetical protein PR003_g15046 [Phytophthora rubi]